MNCKDKVKAIREQTRLSRKEFCEKYQIPYQTVTDWELGHRVAPEYVLRMLEYYVFMQEITKSEQSEAVIREGV